MKHLYRIAIIASACLLATSAVAQSLEKAWETTTELKGPESAIYDAQRDIIYISNVNGAPNEADGNGFISTMSTDGTITNLEWITGLNAPKGLTISGDKLYASDINELIEIEIESGTIANRYKADGAQFLNDVAADGDGNIYVSDMVTDTVYRLSDGTFEAWLHDDMLENPNGLHIEGDKLIVGSWGKMTDGFNTEVPGHLKSVSLRDGAITSLGSGAPVGNLDGVEADGNGNYYVTDWMAGKLFHITPAGDANALLELGPGSADHEVIAAQGLIVIPMMMDNKVIAYKITQ